MRKNTHFLLKKIQIILFSEDQSITGIRIILSHILYFILCKLLFFRIFKSPEIFQTDSFDSNEQSLTIVYNVIIIIKFPIKCQSSLNSLFIFQRISKN